MFRKLLLQIICLLLLFNVSISVRAEDDPTESDFGLENINNFMSYDQTKNESVQLSTLRLALEYPVLDLPEPGGFNLKVSLTNVKVNKKHLCAFKSGWIWRVNIPIWDESNQLLILPDGRNFSFNNSNSSNKVDCGDIIVTCDSNKNVILSNGITISPWIKHDSDESYELVTFPNGNAYKIWFVRWYWAEAEEYGYDDDPWWRIANITDPLGRKIYNFYIGYNDNYCSVISIGYPDDTAKWKFYWNEKIPAIYTDAENRQTTYYLKGGNLKITYPNGSISEYILTSHSYSAPVKQHNLYRKGETTPFKTTIYTGENKSGDFYGKVTVNDGTCIKKYTLEKGYPTIEETYDRGGTLLREKIVKTYTYNDDPRKSGHYYAYPTQINHYPCTSSGALSSTPSTYTYAYDNYHNVTLITDPYGTKTYMAYANTSSNKMLLTIDIRMQNASYTTGVGYHQMVTKATLVTDKIHNTVEAKQTHYKYDATTGNLLLKSEVYDYGYNNLYTYYTYDEHGNLLTKTDANGNKLCYEYADSDDQPYKSAYLTKISTADGKTVASYDYDFNTGNKTKATDGNGNVYNYSYDNIDRLTLKYLYKGDIRWEILYDDTDNSLIMFYGNRTTGNQATQIYYDPFFGKATKIQRYDELLTGSYLSISNSQWITQKEYEYNTCGQIALERDGMGHQTTYTYDELGRQTKISKPANNITQFAYSDRSVTITDANGNQKVQTYDLLGRLTAVAEYPSSSKTYTTTFTYDDYYDNSGAKPVYHLIKTVNPNNAATTNTYDNLGRLTKTVYPQNGINPLAAETYTYDNVGNLRTKTNGKGTKKLDYEFFAGYRLKKVTEPDGKVVSYNYDANDNLLTQTTTGVNYIYTYDARNRVTNLNAQLDGYTFNVGYDYDTFSRVTALTYPGRSKAVNYTYDELDRIKAVEGFTYEMLYDKDNKLEYYNLKGLAKHYSYDDNDRITRIRVDPIIGDLMELNYSYDAVGNITKIENEFYDSATQTSKTSTDYYGYDGLNRLIWYGNLPYEQKASTSGTTWSYDGAGNMITKETSQGSITFGYDKANRLLTMGTTNFTNDNTGARTGKIQGTNTWTYDYDGESRLTQVNKNGATQVQCGYDGNGMRYKKVENGKTIYYIYSGSNPLVEYSSTDGKYTYRIYAGKQAVAEEKGGVVKYYHKDHLGSTRVVTDASGNKVAEYKYAPYGEKETSTGTGSDYQFTDKTTDASTGLSYYGARYYDPEVGRFITVDPGKDGMNWYAYANDNPLIFVDPTGLWVSNNDGTFFAESGDTLWGLQQETGVDWHFFNYQGDPRNLQIGQTVGITINNNNSGVIIDSNFAAIAHYYNGNGTSVNLGNKTQKTLKNNPDQLKHQERIVNGQTSSLSGNYGVNLTGSMFHVGHTVVEYSTTCGTKYCLTTFTGFVHDGFWDITPGKGDGPGPKCELGGTPYAYNTYSWIIVYPNPY
jgi:RHS repeat-associated protein